jgi:hypothetical protein
MGHIYPISGMVFRDTSYERASSVQDYQITCSDFINEISKDYNDWVDRYQLSASESTERKEGIDSAMQTTTDWIYEYGLSIKKIDIIMNDGISKMAECTAGYPFEYKIYVGSDKRFVKQPLGTVTLSVNAVPRQGRRIRIGNYQKGQVFLINSETEITYSSSDESFVGGDILKDMVLLETTRCKKNDLISITTIVEEIQDSYVTEKRGYTTLILLS